MFIDPLGWEDVAPQTSVLVVIMIYFLCLFLITMLRGIGWVAFLLAGVGAFAGVRGWRGHRTQKRPRFAAIIPEGIVANLEAHRGLQRTNWSNVVGVTRPSSLLRVEIHLAREFTFMPASGVFRSPEEVERFLAYANAQTVDRSTTGRVVASPAALPPHAPTDHHDRALTAGATSVAQDLDLPETIVGLHECVSRQRRALPLQVAVVLQMMLIPAEEMFSLSPTVRYAWPLVAFGVVPLILHFLLPRKHGVPQALALGRHRLRFVRGDVELLSLPWEMVSGATCSRWTGKFRILGNGGSDLYVCRHDRFGGLRTVRRAAEQITATARERNHAPICDAPARASLESEGAPRA